MEGEIEGEKKRGKGRSNKKRRRCDKGKNRKAAVKKWGITDRENGKRLEKQSRKK